MVAYLKASPQEKTYSDYLQAAREAEKEDYMELPQSPCNQSTDNTAKPRTTSFFPFQKFKGTEPALKTPNMCLVHLDEESAEKDEEVESEDPKWYQWGFERVHGAPGKGCEGCPSKEKCCYHCSSLEHFICDYPLVKSLRVNMYLNCKEWMALRKGTQTPQIKVIMPKPSRSRPPRCGMTHSDSLLEY